MLHICMTCLTKCDGIFEFEVETECADAILRGHAAWAA